MLRTAKALPASNMLKLLDVIALQWFYVSFHKNNNNKFVTTNKKLKTERFETVTEFFEAQFNQNKVDGMLERMELRRIKKHTHPKLKGKLRDKICACEDERCTYRAKCELVSQNA
jgi:hypothetical protein